ncbi:MAG TPA: MFS transporter [Myxococcales bacterium LLY-WYZ-16_1]|nr:MFS transporter [Myxococcales bacterium LLY-WYZ-16_1]
MIPRALASLAAFYFCIYGAFGAILPFLALVLRGRGLSEAAVGGLILWIPAASVWAPPVWGWAADRFRIRPVLMRGASLGAAAALSVLAARPGVLATWLAVVAFGFFRAPLGSMADAATYAALGPMGHRYARVRVWGSIGFVAVAAGLAPQFSLEATLWLAVAGHALAAAVAFGIRMPPASPSDGQPSVWARVAATVRRERLAPLWVGTLLYASASGIYDGYFGLRLEDLGHGPQFVGWAWGLAVTAEVAVLAAAPRWIRRVDRSAALALLSGVAAVRWLLLGLLEDPRVLLGSQLLHGLTFGLWYLVLVQRFQARAGEGERTSLQALAASGMGGGLMVGVGVGGAVYDRWGSGGAFLLAAGMSLAAGVAYTIESRILAGQVRRGMETSSA